MIWDSKFIILIIRIIKANIIKVIIVLNPIELAIYLLAIDLFLATSLTVNVLNPKSINIPKILVNARAKDRTPNSLAPK